MQHIWGLSFMIFFMALIFGASHVGATQEPIPCDPESTDMIIDYGAHIVCEIDEIGDADSFRFTGKADELIIITALQISSIEPCIQLKDPDSVVQTACHRQIGNGITTRLEKDGVYTIVLLDVDQNERGRYRIHIDRITPPSAETPVFLFEERESRREGELLFSNDFDLWSFNGERDDVISLVAQGGGPEAIQPCIQLFSPLGERVAITCHRSQSNAITNFTLNETGTYTVYVRDVDFNNQSPYTITARCDSGSCVRFASCHGIPATISGTEGDNIINGTEPNVVLGTDGNDVIVGLGGNDIIYGFGGDDIICGGDGHDVIIGGDGNDLLIGNSGNDVLNGGNGEDELHGDDGADVCDGGAEVNPMRDIADISCDFTTHIP